MSKEITTYNLKDLCNSHFPFGGVFWIQKILQIQLTSVSDWIQRNKSAGLIAIFIISIIQVSFLFFLANQAANQTANPKQLIHQLSVDIYWYNLMPMKKIMLSLPEEMVKRL